MLHFFPKHWLRVMVIGLASPAACLVGCAGQKTASDKVVTNNLASDSIPPDSSFKEVIIPEPARGLEPPSKLSPSLQRLALASERSRDLDPSAAGSADLPSPDQVGYPAPGTTDLFSVAIHIKPDADIKAISAAGAHVQTRLGNILFATVHAHNLVQVAEVEGVERVAPMPGTFIPTPPKMPAKIAPPAGDARELQTSSGDNVKFDHAGLTGKGVIVGVIDTGIDWRHADFRNPDGSTRILCLWDIFDDSWEKSNHTIGSKPPMDFEPGKPMGTLYTSQQINAAIKGQLKIARPDKIGHGTACAGTAAGNVLGVAPQADLVIVNSHMEIPDSENDGVGGVQGAQWIKQIAAERHEPCVISMSYYGLQGAHDGTEDTDAGYNAVADAGEAPGLVMCVCAGNCGQQTMHARGRFGPPIAGEFDAGRSDVVQLYVTQPAELLAIFDTRDDWRLHIMGLDKFLFGTDQRMAGIYFFKNPQNKISGLHIWSSPNVRPADLDTLTSLFEDKKIALEPPAGSTESLAIVLPPGAYLIMAGGNSEQVMHGVFDLYLPSQNLSTFGLGGDHNMVVGDPGDSDDVITVASYDFRNQWSNVQGTVTRCDQVDVGNISSYSSPGLRRDGVVKPDIAGPGQFTISAFADGSAINGFGPAGLTPDGKHVAWAGTSASTPYTAGVVALMLEKNPHLTANQVKQILHDTADHDFAVTGAVPNPQWGYGKLNPEKALAMVTAGSVAPPSTQPGPIQPAPVAPLLKSPFAGTYKGDGLTLVLVPNADGTFGGTLLKGDTTFPLQARLVASLLEGTVHGQSGDFSFTAALNGDELMLSANEKAFKLTRQPPGS